MTVRFLSLDGHIFNLVLPFYSILLLVKLCNDSVVALDHHVALQFERLRYLSTRHGEIDWQDSKFLHADKKSTGTNISTSKTTAMKI